jgi:hypothetical protein
MSEEGALLPVKKLFVREDSNNVPQSCSRFM